MADAFALNFARVLAFLKGRLGMVLNIFGKVFGRVWEEVFGRYLDCISRVLGGVRGYRDWGGVRLLGGPE